MMHGQKNIKYSDYCLNLPVIILKKIYILPTQNTTQPSIISLCSTICLVLKPSRIVFTARYELSKHK